VAISTAVPSDPDLHQPWGVLKRAVQSGGFRLNRGRKPACIEIDPFAVARDRQRVSATASVRSRRQFSVVGNAALGCATLRCGGPTMIRIVDSLLRVGKTRP
jgi:hypothetical protein